MSSKRPNSGKGFAPRPLVRINSSMVGGGERTAITQAQSLENLTEASLKKKMKKAAATPIIEEVAATPPIETEETEPINAEEAADTSPEPEAQSEEEIVETEAELEDSTEQVESKQPTVELTKEHIDLIAQTAAEKAALETKNQLNAEHNKEIEDVRAQLEAANKAAAEAEQKAKKALEEKEVLAGVFNTLGYTEPVKPEEAKGKEMVATPNIARYTQPNSDEPFGAIKDALDILEVSAASIKTMPGGSQYIYADQTELNRFVVENRADVVRDMEKWAKANGMLRGNRAAQTYAQVKAATTIGDIPGGFLDVLSALMRTENRGRLVMWQFPITVHQFDKGMGNQVEIPRAPYITPPTTSDQRVLSGGGVYRPIDPGNQNIQTGIELATLLEYGLGASAQAAPVMIPTFINSYSMIDLMAILQRNMMRDYYATEEVAIREQYKKTNSIIYNNNGQVTTTPTVGTLSSTYLNNLFAYMQELSIPTYANGCYVGVWPSKVIADYKNSFQGTGTLWQAPSPQALMDLTNILNPTTIGTGEVDKVTGYVGTYNNFMIFDTNSYGVGGATANGVNGVQTEGIGVTRSGFVFGADAVGRGVGTEFQIVQDEKTDFGRSNRFIWRSEEAFHALDVAPQTGDPRPIPQQLRVLETRFS